MTGAAVATVARLLAGCHARWREPPPAPGPRVYYANHTSHLDAPLIWAALPPDRRARCHIVAAADYWDRGALRRWLANRVFRAVLIDRTRVTRSNNPLEPMLAALDAGDALIIFPEGGRQECGEPIAFRSGLWRLARKRPVVPFTPVWLENLGRVLPKGEYLPLPILTAVTFGESVHIAPDEPRDLFLERLRRELIELRGATT